MTQPAAATPSRRRRGGRRPGPQFATRAAQPPQLAVDSRDCRIGHTRRPAVVAAGARRPEPHLRRCCHWRRGRTPRSGFRGTCVLAGLSLFAGCLVAVLLAGRKDGGSGRMLVLSVAAAARQPSWPGRPGSWPASGLADPRTRRTTPASLFRCGPTRCCSCGRQPPRAATSPSACSNCCTARGTGARTPATASEHVTGTRSVARKMNR